ncbi:MAG: hypothetical protein AB7S26_13875 [Sandaracinaceae bacterium]
MLDAPAAGSRRTSPEGGGEAPSGPRFALRFDRDGGVLALAQPFDFELGCVESLELELPQLTFPLDLSAGPGRFRTHRTRVRAAQVRLNLDRLLGERFEEPFALRPLAPSAASPSTSQGFLLRDAFGAVAFEAHVRAEAGGLRIAIEDARAVAPAPAPPLVRALLAARTVGLRWSDTHGTLALPRALSGLLTVALVPFGWRVPDDRACRLALEPLSARRLRVRTLAATEAEPTPEPGCWEAAARMAPSVRALIDGQLEVARAAYADLVERGHGESVARYAASLGLARPDLREDAMGIALAFVDALETRDGALAAGLAERLERVEPADELAVEALSAAAELLRPTDPSAAGELLARAAARRPTDARIALRLIAAVADRGDERALDAALSKLLALREAGTARGELARDAAEVCALAGSTEASDRLFDLAAAYLPDDPRALLGAAAASARRGDVDAALDRYDRAAHRFGEHGDGDDVARALEDGARVAERAGRLEAAEARFERSGQVRERATVFAALARVRRALGRAEAARRAEDRALSFSAELSAMPLDVQHALHDAARAALDAADVARAHAFVGALRRAGVDGADFDRLTTALEARELSLLLADPVRLTSLEPARLARALATSEEPEALVGAALVTLADAERATFASRLRDAARWADAPTRDAIDVALAPFATAPTASPDTPAQPGEDAAPTAGPAPAEADEPASSIGAAVATTDPAQAAEPASADPSGALALARRGAESRDTATLRAALAIAQRAGDREAAREIVAIALEVVGDGPARGSLLAIQRELDD